MAGLREAGIYPEYSQNDYEFAAVRQSEMQKRKDQSKK